MDNKVKATKILSIEAKDLYNSNNLKYDNPTGYTIRKDDKSINTKLFINTLTYVTITINFIGNFINS